MRKVKGPTDRIVVVGAGLAGLSAALRLAGAGRTVTVLERASEPGGRCGVLRVNGYAFDTGPTVLTMPHLIADALSCVGEELDDWLELLPLDPLYRARFADGSSLDVHREPERMADEITRLCGPAEAVGYRRYVEFVSALYRAEMRDFIDRNIDSPLQLLTPDLARLAALGGFRRLAPKVATYLGDPRLRKLFSFQALYAGLSPYDALAIYAVIAYMDTVAGVFFPRGGMHMLPRALAGAAVKHGVEIRYGTGVSRVLVTHERAAGVITEAGELVPADVVVLNPDLPVAYRELLPEVSVPRRIRAQRYSPSCCLLLCGSNRRYDQAAHHNLHLGGAWRETFEEVVDRGELMSDPSFLLTNPTRTDPSLAPGGRESYYALFPVPNLRAGLDWTELGPRYRDEILATLEARGYDGFAAEAENVRLTTPADWAARGMQAGTPFAAAHSFLQTGPFRATNLAPVEGVVFTGSGTQPGVGVPMVLISGRLAAERITGRDGAYRRRSYR